MREILTASAQGEEDMQQIPPELLLFHSIPVIPFLLFHSEFKYGMTATFNSSGSVTKNCFLAKWAKNFLGMGSYVISGPSLLYYAAFLLAFPHLLLSGMLLWNERTTLWFLLLSGKGKRGQMVNLSLWLRFAFVWCEWWCCDTQCVLNHIFALMKSRFWEP